MELRVLVIGDIVGKPGREILNKVLPGLIAEEGIHFVIANAENIAQGSGITPSTYKEVLRAGVDVITLGDHTWKRKEALPLIEKDPKVLRPLNYPPECLGRGMDIFQARDGSRIAVVTLLGRIFMNPADCPFHGIDRALERIDDSVDAIFVEIHAEATSEKVAMGWKLDGRVSCVYGTHTHIPTADERVLPRGTAYITDLGMTGPYNSVIGRCTRSVLYKFETGMHAPFDVASGDERFCGALVRVESTTRRAIAIERILRV